LISPASRAERCNDGSLLAVGSSDDFDLGSFISALLPSSAGEGRFHISGCLAACDAVMASLLQYGAV
jgi:hypothetical protein